MSNIRIDNIAPSAGGTYRNAPRGIAAAWVNFDGTGTIVARDSVNVASLTDNGTGDYTVNLTGDMGNTNYSGEMTSTIDISSGSGNVSVGFYSNGNTNGASYMFVGSFRIIVQKSNYSEIDSDVICASIHGDLA
tara:strand:- start:424 stop:825 length:402 start_codon:yes stop_codon:yes gene_type:complete